MGTIVVDKTWELDYPMHVISKKALIEFWSRHPDAEGPLRAWYHEACAARWESHVELKEKYLRASVINAERVVFDIGGNKYRLVVRINYPGQTVFVRFIGTHREYEKKDVETC